MAFDKINSVYPWSSDSVDIASFISRLIAGSLMLVHGFPKLSHIINGDFSFGNPIGIGEIPSLFLATGAEVGCSVFLMMGLYTRWAILPLIFTMLVIIFRVLLPLNAPWERIESATYFLILYILIFILGSGKFSLDYKLKKKK